MKVDKETNYEKYRDTDSLIVNEIELLRKKIALENYNTRFDKLSLDQQNKIKNDYPINIIFN